MLTFVSIIAPSFVSFIFKATSISSMMLSRPLLLLAVLGFTLSETREVVEEGRTVYPRWSSAYAWNASSLPASSFNLAQAASVGEALTLADRGIESVLANIQATIFVRASGVGSVLVDDWELKLDSIMEEMVGCVTCLI